MAALHNYLGTLGSTARFYNFGVAGTEIEATGAIEARNDPTAWVSYGLTAMTKGWGSLGAGSPAVEALLDLVLRSLSSLADTVFAAVGEAISAGFGSIPILNILVDMLDLVIGQFVEIGKMHGDMNAISSRRILAETRIFWIDTYLGEKPDRWLMETRQNVNRPKYRGEAGEVQPVAGKRWNTAPAWRPTRDQALLFLDKAGRKPSGKCKVFNSYYLNCPAVLGRVNHTGCVKSVRTKDSADYCVSDITISALFYPWWSPGYPAGPMQIAQAYGNDPWDPNASLIARQLALLTDPASNLRASGRKLSRMTSKFVTWWAGKELGELYPVDSKGNRTANPGGEFLAIDSRRDKTWTGAPRLYYDHDGLIRSYSGGIDLARWGLFNRDSLGRGKDGGNLAVTVAQYNTIVTMTLAFFTSRANMLRNGYLMRGIVETGQVGDLDKDVRAAVRDAAEIGGSNIPSSQVARVAFKKKGPTVAGIKAKLKGAPKKKFSLAGFKAKIGGRSAMLDAVKRAGGAGAADTFPWVPVVAVTAGAVTLGLSWDLWRRYGGKKSKRGKRART